MLHPPLPVRFANFRAAIQWARQALPALTHSLAMAALTVAAATTATASTGTTTVHRAAVTMSASAAVTSVQPNLTNSLAASTTPHIPITPAIAATPTIPAPAIQLAAATGKPARSGASIYSVSCASCHTYGMRGAPKLTDKAAWAPRLAQPPGTLTAHVIKGLGWMPPRGTCSACSDDDIQAAVDYMVSRLPTR